MAGDISLELCVLPRAYLLAKGLKERYFDTIGSWRAFHEDVRWASYTRKGGVEKAMKEQCWSCATVAMQSYPSMTWLEIVSMCKTSQDWLEACLNNLVVFCLQSRFGGKAQIDCFTSERGSLERSCAKSPVTRAQYHDFSSIFSLAKRVLEKPELKTFIPEILQDTTSVQMLMQRHLLFLTEEEFQEKLSVKPTSLELPIIDTVDEEGRPIRGVFMQNPEKPFREVALQHMTSMEHAKQLMSPSQQLRANQGASEATDGRIHQVKAQGSEGEGG
eukprot:6492638-Amphidinium_carterae.3